MSCIWNNPKYRGGRLFSGRQTLKFRRFKKIPLPLEIFISRHFASYSISWNHMLLKQFMYILFIYMYICGGRDQKVLLKDILLWDIIVLWNYLIWISAVLCVLFHGPYPHRIILIGVCVWVKRSLVMYIHLRPRQTISTQPFRNHVRRLRSVVHLHLTSEEGFFYWGICLQSQVLHTSRPLIRGGGRAGLTDYSTFWFIRIWFNVNYV